MEQEFRDFHEKRNHPSPGTTQTLVPFRINAPFRGGNLLGLMRPGCAKSSCNKHASNRAPAIGIHSSSQWPNFEALAAANSEEVMKAWQGLGYYSRARNLHKAAHMVVHEWKLELPKTAKDWQALPGVGPYTAAAIASICFGDPTAAVDGNALRVLSRWAGIAEPIDKPAGKKPIEKLAQTFLNIKNPGMHNQAVMELGALVCTPKSPACDVCPIHEILP